MAVVVLAGFVLLSGAPVSGEEISAMPDPLILMPRHSADTVGDPFQIDVDEAARVFDIWRAGGYGLEGSAADGYSSIATDTNGLPHSADYADPFWQIGFDEMLRFLALHRASSYRYSASALDRFAPESDGWIYEAPAAGSTAGATRYVSVDSTNAVSPFLTLETAATSIQDVLEVAGDGDLILVEAGVYNQGGVSNEYGMSRVAITSGVTVASIAGPATTFIEGDSTALMRGVLMNHTNASLMGFTVQQGATDGSATNVIARDGGGMLLLQASLVSDCVVRQNTAMPWGTGGGVRSDEMAGTLQRLVITDNTALFGGGMRILRGMNLIMTQCLISENNAGVDGGGLHVDNATKLYNLVVRDNEAGRYGGGLMIFNNVTIWNSTVSGNAAVDAGAGVYLNGTSATLRNCLIAENAVDEIYATNANNTIRYSMFPYDETLGINLISNVYETPLFVNAAEGNLRLLPESSGVNQGESNAWMNTYVEMDGMARLGAGVPDIGAYESHVPVAVAAPSFYIPGEEVEVDVAMNFASGLRPLTLGFRLDVPADWSEVSVSGNFEFEASPDGLGYVATGSLPDECTLTITLLADSAAIGDVPFDVTFFWMLSGMEQVQESSLMPAPYTIEPLYPVVFVAQEGGGLSSTGGWYAVDAEVEITAIPDAGWRFLEWEGDLALAEIEGNVIRLTVDGAATVSARFMRVFELQIATEYGISEPSAGAHIYDVGSLVEISVPTPIVSAGGSNYVCVGWTGTGSVPASGSARTLSFTIEEASSITWQWSWLEARHASRGYRAAGHMMARVQCQITYQPAPTIQQVWWRPIMPTGWEITHVEGDDNPTIDGDVILINENLAGGSVSFFYDVRIADDAVGLLEIGAEAGVNAP
jgi:hypothetical protein